MKKYINKAKKFLATLMSTLILLGVIVTPTVLAAVDVSNTIPVKESNKPANQIFKPDNKGQYSSWETKNSGFTVTPAYAFRPKSSSDTKYTLIGIEDRANGIKTMNDYDVGGNKIFNTDDDYIYSTKNNTKGNVGWKGTNFQIFNVQTGGYDDIDMKVTIMDWTVHPEAASDPFIYLQHGPRPEIRIMGLSESEIQIEYLKAGTNTPYTLTGNLTFNDIDDTQYVAIRHNQIQNIFADPESRLNYGSVDGYDVFWCPAEGNDTTGTPQLAMGATYSSSKLNLKFGTKHKGTWSYFGFYAYSMVYITPPDPIKTVSDSNENMVNSNTLSSPNESFTYRVRQAVPAGISDEFFYSKFVMEDTIDSCLTIESAKVFRDSTDVSDMFNILISNNKVIATVKNLNEESLYGGKNRNGAVYDLTIKSHIDKFVTHETLKSHGHFNDLETALNFKNKGIVTINDIQRTTNETMTVVDLPKTTDGTPGLNIKKSVTPYEHQVGDDINYKIIVNHSNKDATAVDIIVSDKSLPDDMVIDEESYKITGITGYEIKTVKGGWELTAPTLSYGQTITIEFTARATKVLNGTIIPNAATAVAWQVPEKSDNAEVYINSPKLCITKKADKDTYKVGDTAKYELNLTQINTGCFMRSVTIADEIKTEGVKLVPGSIQIMDDKGKIITHECQIVTKGNTFTITTHRNMGNENASIPVNTAPYNNLNLLTELRVTYDATILEGKLAGEKIDNIAISPSTPNTNGDKIKDDPDIPSGGDSTDASIKAKAPKLNIEKKSDKKIYQVGETGKYTLTVTQTKENAIARNVIINDHFTTEGMAVDFKSIKVSKNGEDITKSCAITDTAGKDTEVSSDELKIPAVTLLEEVSSPTDAVKPVNSFSIQTNTNLTDEDTLVVTYDVTFLAAVAGQKVTNIAETVSDNTPPAETTNEVEVPKTPKFSIVKKSDKEQYKVGDTAKYTLTILQINENATAENVVIADAFKVRGFTYIEKSIAVNFNGRDITKQCQITVKGLSFQIITGVSLTEKDTLLVSYNANVTKDAHGKEIINTAIAKGDNTPPSETQNKVSVPKAGPEKDNPENTTDSPKTGDNSNIFLWLGILAVAVGGIIIVGWNIRKRNNRK